MGELQEFAKSVLLSAELDAKLGRPAEPLTDQDCGPGRRVTCPVRPANLVFAARRTAPAMPKASALSDSAKRAVAHHIMANHELQALEVMAMILLAFPETPAEFRFGLAAIMQDEQRHCRMHVQRCAELGVNFGDFPVNGWIWKKAQDYRTPLEYVAGLPLVFEGANLDHTVEFEAYFRDAGDRRSAAIMRAIHKDEIRHVEFGMTWLRRWKRADQSDWDAWQSNLRWPIRPKKARGDRFQREARLAAGFSEDFINRLESEADTISENIEGAGEPEANS